MIVLGLSSGTSMDGIDVAAADLRLEGAALRLRPLGHLEIGYDRSVRDALRAALPPAPTSLAEVARLDTLVGQEFARAAVRGLAELAGDAALVVSHGQTLFHWVEDGRVRGTLQVGQPAWIAEATGLPVVSDVRVADVAAGGQGAPLASTLDVLALGTHDLPAAALNLGGIANVTVLPAAGPPVAFDTGPANALLDAAVARLTDGREHVDADGVRAGRGAVDPALLERLLAHPYYAAPAPKSTGKEVFHAGYLGEVLADRPDPGGDDLLATLVELTARTVADALGRYDVRRVHVSGGGARNPVLLRRLEALLRPAELRPVDDLGLPGDAKEAYLFALLGFLSWHGLPGTVPACTGARHESVAGRITPGTHPLRLPDPVGEPPRRLVVDPGPGTPDRTTRTTDRVSTLEDR